MLLYNHDYIVIFGGIQEITREKDDVTAFHLKTNKWITLQLESSFNRSTSPLKKLANPHESNKSTIKSVDKVKPTTLQIKRDNSVPKSTKIKPNQSNSNLRPSYNPTNNTNVSRNIVSNQATRASHTRVSGNASFYIKTEKDVSIINKSGYLDETSSPNSSALKTVKDEKRKRMFLMKKHMLLSEFEILDPQQKLLLQMKSPTTEAMKSSILALNYKRGTSTGIGTATKHDEHKKKTSNYTDSTILESLHFPSIINFVPPNGKIAGHRPCARDGHSASIYKGKIIIFGGDRHKMSFNDIYLFNLDKAIKDNE